jgi:hypothetical protein
MVVVMSSEKPAQDTGDRGWRGKLYLLEEGQLWLDQGTGNIYCRVDDSRHKCLVMIDESNGKELLCTRIQANAVYERQNGMRRISM